MFYIFYMFVQHSQNTLPILTTTNNNMDIGNKTVFQLFYLFLIFE